MFEADLKGKLPLLDNSEDYLTSCFFGILQYMPLKLLFSILRHSVRFQTDRSFEGFLSENQQEFSSYTSCEFYFWPKSEEYGEPDLVLVLHGQVNALIGIEIKYLSSKSGTGDNDQLMRYYLALSDPKNRNTFSDEKIRNFRGDFLGLIYLTQYSADKEVNDSIRMLKQKGYKQDVAIFNLRWEQIYSELSTVLKGSPENQIQQKVVSDLLRLLELRNLNPFAGFSKLHEEIKNEELSRVPVFYEYSTPPANKFSGFKLPPEELKVLENDLEIIFYHPKNNLEKNHV